MRFDNNIFIQRRHRLRGLLFALHRAADTGQHFDQIGGFGVFQIDHFGVALRRLLAVELLNHGDDPLARVGLAADQHRVGALVGHHVGDHRAGQGRFAGIFVEFSHQLDHIGGGGP